MGKKFKMRGVSLLTIFIIVYMSFIDSFIYRPMEAYAATSVPWDSGSYSSAVTDLLHSFGVAASERIKAASVAYDLFRVVEEREKQVIEEYGSWEAYADVELERIRFWDKAGEEREFLLKVKNVMAMRDFITDAQSATPGKKVRVSREALDTMRWYAATKLNISAVDGSAPKAVIELDAKAYIQSFKPLPLSFSYTDSVTGTFHSYSSSGPVWVGWYRMPNSGNYYVYVAAPGTVLNSRYIAKDGESGTSSDIFPDELKPCGFSVNNCWYNVICYPRQYPGLEKAGVTYDKLVSAKGGEFNPSHTSYKVALDYLASPTIDVPYTSADSVTWQGVQNLADTLKNQAAAGNHADYLDKVITMDGAVLPTEPAIPTEGVTDGADTGEPDFTLSGVVGWLEKIYSGILSLPGSIADRFSSALAGLGVKLDAIPAALAEIKEKIISIPDTISRELTKLGKWVQAIPAALADIKEKITSIPDTISRELTKLGEWVQTIPAALADIKEKITSIPDTISRELTKLGEWVQTIPAALVDIKEKITSIPDTISKELTKLGEWVQTIPQALVDVKDAVLSIPKAIASAWTTFWSLDVVRLERKFTDMTDALKAKLSALQQIRDIFGNVNLSFSDTPPIIKMKTPDALKFAIQADEMVVMDLSQFASIFSWCRTLLSALMWVAFGKWVIEQFDVKFHIG